MSLSRLAAAGVAAGLLAVTVVAADPKPVVVKLGHLSAVASADWKAEKPANRLRSYQFKLPGEPTDAELIVMPESHPDPAKSFPRWKESFAVPEGMTTDDICKASKFDSAGATFHVLDATGTWKFKERPFDPKSKEEAKPDFRVVWVIVAEKDEATHLRLSGPKDAVAKHHPAFEAWLKALK